MIHALYAVIGAVFLVAAAGVCWLAGYAVDRAFQRWAGDRPMETGLRFVTGMGALGAGGFLAMASYVAGRALCGG
jgi:hypothetical protein